VTDEAGALSGRLDLPYPLLPEGLSSDLGGLPGDEPAFSEVDDMVLAIDALGQRRDEGTAGPPHPLPLGGGPEVVVAVPFRLPAGICDEFEHRLGGCLDIDLGADHLESGVDRIEDCGIRGRFGHDAPPSRMLSGPADRPPSGGAPGRLTAPSAPQEPGRRAGPGRDGTE